MDASQGKVLRQFEMVVYHNAGMVSGWDGLQQRSHLLKRVVGFAEMKPLQSCFEEAVQNGHFVGIGGRGGDEDQLFHT